MCEQVPELMFEMLYPTVYRTRSDGFRRGVIAACNANLTHLISRDVLHQTEDWLRLRL
jgi:hypothetical protein